MLDFVVAGWGWFVWFCCGLLAISFCLGFLGGGGEFEIFLVWFFVLAEAFHLEKQSWRAFASLSFHSQIAYSTFLFFDSNPPPTPIF